MKQSPPLYIFAYYRPPKYTQNALESLEKALKELQQLIAKKNSRICLLVAGDFNESGNDWTTDNTKY